MQHINLINTIRFFPIIIKRQMDRMYGENGGGCGTAVCNKCQIKKKEKENDERQKNISVLVMAKAP